MPMWVKPSEWVPCGVDDLEPTAFEVVRSTTHTSVIAGPGAGKTELLAQRACYLLQTGFCPPPRRILAISFKTDAAKNLKARVGQRCIPDHAKRFDSLTFDAFAKGFIDRFLKALPSYWRPTDHYGIDLKPPYKEFFGRVGDPPPTIGSRYGMQHLTPFIFEKDYVLGTLLPERELTVMNAGTWAAAKWWQEHLRLGTESQLTFPMIGRLAELLLRTNPRILRALQMTYAYVFMDEFQDTTHVQYDLMKTGFFGSSAILTAVGDNKQQIMRWAMALPDPFGVFEHDFGARRVSLIRNYRSTPELVRIQHAIAQVVDNDVVEAQSMRQCEVSGDVCKILEFASPEREADYIAQYIAESIDEYDLTPGDFAILVKQMPQNYAPLLVASLRMHGIKGRDEGRIQDILAERLTSLLVAFMRLGATTQAGIHWATCVNLLVDLWSIDREDTAQRYQLQQALGRYQKRLARVLQRIEASEASIEQGFREIIDFVGERHIKGAFAEYQRGEWFQTVLREAAQFLAQSRTAVPESWVKALDDFEGKDRVPIMTIHKSKGLEYHTVFFVALDDRAWWSFAKQPEEARSAFFVAFSRAKQRILFTYCESRGARYSIASLYDILHSAKVQAVVVEDVDDKLLV